MAVSTNEILTGQPVAPVAPGISNPAQVYTTSNITNAVTNPTPAPDDLLGIRNQINQELGLPGLQTAYQEQFKGLTEAQTRARAQQTALEGLGGESVNAIRGFQAQAGRLSSDQIAALASSAQVAQNALQAAQQEAAARFDIRQSEVAQKRQLMLQYPGAKISFADSFESARAKLDTYQQEQEKKIYKDTLKAKALELGLKTKGTTKELEKRLKKANKEAVKEAKADAALKRRKDEADIANIYSTITERGKKSTETPNIDFSNKGLASLIEEGANMGDDWGTIAATLESQAPGSTRTGGFADKYLRHLFLGDENPLG